MFTLLRKKPCRDWRLYVITDRTAAKNRPLKEIVKAAIEGGASAIQLRDKEASDSELISTARDLLTVTRPARIPLIINDRIHVAKEVGADGVHLGQDDASFKEAREALGKKAIIGRSTHTPGQAKRAEGEGFD